MDNQNNNEKEMIAKITEDVNKQEEQRKIKEIEDARIKEINELQKKENNKESNKLQNKYILLLIIIIALFGCILLAYKVIFNKEEQKPSSDAPLEERISYVLKKRYGKEFTKIKDNTYQDENNNSFTISTNSNTSSKLIVFDEYLNDIQVNKITSKISTILTSKGLTNITVNLAPEKDCRFVGSCISNDNYFNNYKENTDENLLSERSDSIVLKDYVNMSNSEFFNKFKFTIYIKIVGNYKEQDKGNIKNVIEYLFNELNDSGYENNLGYEINVKDAEGIKDIMTLIGTKSDNKKFSLLEAKEN